MGKMFRLICVFAMFFFVLSCLAYADENASSGNQNQPGVGVASENYRVSAIGFYWNTSVSTPNYTSTNTSYGGELNLRFTKSSGVNGLGFGVEYTDTTNNGPRFINTGGACTSSFGGFTGFSVSTGLGQCGLVSPGGWQFGGGKVKYFLPTGANGFDAAIYGDYFSSSGGRSAWGGGVELDYAFNKEWMINSYVDYGNVTGNAFPSQNLWRYEAYLSYKIPNTNVDFLAGYRGYNYTKYYPTNINGFIIGVGGHF